MLSTAAEVFVCCDVANECKLCSRHELDQAILMRSLGLPMPDLAEDKDLDELRVTYGKVLDRKGVHYQRIFNILERASKEPDAAAMLLSFLQYPSLVRTARSQRDSGVNSEIPFDQEVYPLDGICKTIVHDSRLEKLCRQVIASSDDHHVLVLSQCIGILESSLDMKKTLSALYVAIMEENEDFDVGFKRIYEDLGKAVARTQLPIEGIMSSLNLLQTTASVGTGSENIMNTMISMVGTPANIYFQKALARLDREISASSIGNFVQDRAAFFFDPAAVGETDFRSLLQSMSPRPPQVSKQSAVKLGICNVPGCKKQGSRRCGKCNLVCYCDSDCQVSHWKTHKLVCKGVVPKPVEMSKLGGRGAQQSSRSVISAVRKPLPAKQRQDKCLAENPERDYVIIGAGDTPNTSRVVYFEDASSKRTFKMMRARAVSEPKYVYLLYDVLLKKTKLTKDQTEILRLQLAAEYGINPLSPEAKDAPCGASMDEWMMSANLGSKHVQVNFENSKPQQPIGTINYLNHQRDSPEAESLPRGKPNFRASDEVSIRVYAKIEEQSVKCMSEITTDFSHNPSEALLRQDKFLQANKDFDYVVFGAGDGLDRDHVIDFKVPSIKTMFRDRRVKAFFSANDVIRLYGHLIMLPEMNSPRKRKLLRSQLTEEYGKDPFESDEEKEEFESKLLAHFGTEMTKTKTGQTMDEILYTVPPELVMLAMVGIVYGLVAST